MWLVIQKGFGFVNKLLTTFNILISAFHVYKHAAETGLSDNTLRKEKNQTTKQTRKNISRNSLPNQYAHQPSGGSESVSTTQGTSLEFVCFKIEIIHKYNLTQKHQLTATDHSG